MDPLKSAQDVVRCTLCQTVAPMYCEVCHIHLCKDCVETHFTDSSKDHKVVPLKQYWTTLNYPKCPKHPTKQCELYCEPCNMPICATCISREHLGHKPVEIIEYFESKKEILQRDLKEFEKSILPKNKEIASNILVQKADLSKNSRKSTTAIDEQGEVWHREIDTIIRTLKSNVEEIESKHLVVLKNQEDEITQVISEITKNIAGLKKLLNSKDVCLVSEYKSRNAEFRRLPPKLRTSLPNFRPQEIHTDQLIQQFGCLSALFFTTEEQDYSMPPQGTESSPPDQPLMDELKVITKKITGIQLGENRETPPPPLPQRSKPSPPKPKPCLQKCRCLFDYNAQDTDEHGFNEGDTIEIIKEDKAGWWRGRLRGKEGLSRANYIEKI